jgi:hypothetical protein
VAKDDRDMEWRLVATKGRESCRWQATDSSWVALSLGAQGDITKVVVTASDSRSEIVDGYEQGLNLARKWRNDWVQSDTNASPSHTSGPWLPALPGRAGEVSDDSMSPIPNDPPSSTRGSIPPGPTSTSRQRLSPPAQGSFPPASPSSPQSTVSRVSQPRPVSRSSQFPVPSLPPGPDDRGVGETRDRWAPAGRPPAGGSSRSIGKVPTDHPDHDPPGRSGGSSGRK